MIRYEAEERDGVEIGFLILARPEKRNALTPDMLDHLSDAASEASASARAIVLIGEGPVFCAGFDLRLALDDPGGSAMRAMLTGLSTVIRTLRRCEVPVVAGVHGGAIAGGCALLGGTDIAVCDERCRFGYPVVRLGVSPAVSVPFFRRTSGDGASRSRTLDPGLFDASTAARIGLVHEVLATPEAVFERAREIAFLLALKPAAAVSATKQWLNELDGADADAHAEWALEASVGLAGSDEERDAIRRAFDRPVS